MKGGSSGGSSGLIALLLSALVFPLFFFLLSLFKDRGGSKRQLRREAYGRFRQSFSACIAELNSMQKGIDLIVSEQRGPHEAAIYEVRGFLPRGDRRRFEAAASIYRKARDSNDPAMLQYAPRSAKALVRKDERQARSELLTAINKLLSVTPPK